MTRKLVVPFSPETRATTEGRGSVSGSERGGHGLLWRIVMTLGFLTICTSMFAHHGTAGVYDFTSSHHNEGDSDEIHICQSPCPNLLYLEER